MVVFCKSRLTEGGVWLDGQPGRDCDTLWLSGLAFSADGQHLAYIVHDPGSKKDFLVLDGREGKQYEEVFFGALKFDGTDGFVFIAREGRKYLHVTQPIP